MPDHRGERQQRERPAPIGTLWKSPEGFYSDITLIGGKAYREPLRDRDGSIVRTPAQAETAMGHLCERLNYNGLLDRRSDVVRFYLGDLEPKVALLPLKATGQSDAPDDDELKVPPVLDLEIASWRRIVNASLGAHDARDRFRQAALALFRTLKIAPTVAPISRGAAHHAAVDALQNFAQLWGLDTDEAQYIMAEAKDSPDEIQRTPAAASESGLITCKASEIAPEKIQWIWPGRIARGKHTTLAGDPGTGKSQLLAWIVAAVTTGGALPCGEGTAAIGSVVILAAEDGVADTMVPRLMAAGADLSKVEIVRGVLSPSGARPFSLASDLGRLEQRIAALGNVQLVCIDPITSYLGNVDSHKNAELRTVLEPVGTMAERCGVGVLSVTHLSKGAVSVKALYRLIGSIAFVAAPRAAFLFVEDPEDKGRRLLLHGKNNLAPRAQGLACRLEQHLVGPEKDIVASCIAWEREPVSTGADDALNVSSDTEPTARYDVAEFLRSVLADGPVAVHLIEKEAHAAGYLSPEHSIGQSKPFRSARALLGIKPFQRKGTKSGGWFWGLPAGQVPPVASDALSKSGTSDGS